MDPFNGSGQAKGYGRLTLAVSFIALGVALYAAFFSSQRIEGGNGNTRSSVPSIVKKLNDTGVLHAGYGVYPPYSIEDPNTKAITGYSVDLIERIGNQMKVKVVWHRVNWNTFIPDIKRGDFDIIADPIFITIPRAREFAFTEPFDYFPDGIVTVRKGDTRLKSFEDLNTTGIRVAVGMGYSSETLARARLPKAEVVPVQTGTDQLQLFNEVAAGRVDATISEAATAQRYLKEHPEIVRVVNMDHPAAWVPGAFALRPDDAEGARVFSACLLSLRTTGEVAFLRKKWGLPAREEPDARGGTK